MKAKKESTCGSQGRDDLLSLDHFSRYPLKCVFVVG